MGSSNAAMMTKEFSAADLETETQVVYNILLYMRLKDNLIALPWAC